MIRSPELINKARQSIGAVKVAWDGNKLPVMLLETAVYDTRRLFAERSENELFSNYLGINGLIIKLDDLLTEAIGT